LAELIHRVAVEKQTFRVTDDYAACAEADVILFDVQTPTDAAQDNHVPHYESLRQVSAEAGRAGGHRIHRRPRRDPARAPADPGAGIRAPGRESGRCGGAVARRDGHEGRPAPFFLA